MSDGAVAALVIGGLVVVGGGVALIIHSRRPVYSSPIIGNRVYGQVAARGGASVASQVLGSISNIAEAYVSSDSGSQHITELLESI